MSLIIGVLFSSYGSQQFTLLFAIRSGVHIIKMMIKMIAP
jgi:hypothetical protein